MAAILDSVLPDRPGSVRVLFSISVIVPALGIVSSEMLVHFGEPELALWGYLGTMMICAVGPIRINDESLLFHSFLLIPVFRLVNLGMPVFVDLTMYWMVLVYGPMLPAVILLIRSSPIAALSIGRVDDVLSTPIFVLIGIVLAEVEYHLLPTEALLPTWTAGGIVTFIIVMVAAIALTEELLFRVLLQRTLENHLGFVAGLVLASTIYGVLHAGAMSVPAVSFGIALGLLLGLVYDWTDALLPIVTIHGTSNIILYGVIPIQGSILAEDALFAPIV